MREQRRDDGHSSVVGAKGRKLKNHPIPTRCQWPGVDEQRWSAPRTRHRQATHTSSIDPSQFYTGIVAELYGPLRSSEPDPDLYAGFLRAAGEPALELGCGDGDPIIELRRRGHDVDGVDSSAEMLDRCRARAAAEGIEIALHHQRMQELDLPRRYRAIYLAGATFNLLTSDDHASSALRGIADHLDVGGSALVPLLVPAATPADRLGHPVEAFESSGARIRVTPVEERRDEARRIHETVFLYERIDGDDRTSEDRTWLLHWHTQGGFRSLADAAGLATVAVLNERGEPASPDATTFAFWLQSKVAST